MNYILFDGENRNALLPLTFTRPVADIRVGILTIREKWEKFLKTTTTTLTEEYLEEKFPLVEFEHNIYINATYIPSVTFFKKVKSLKPFQYITYQNEVIAFYSHFEQEDVDFSNYEKIEIKSNLLQLTNCGDLIKYQKEAFLIDFDLLTLEDISQEIPSWVVTVNPENIFIEEGAKIESCVLNASEGPIYIGKNAVVLDGALVRGPFALGESSVLKMGAKIYGGTSIGPFCKIGGEVKNSIVFGYSNKSHDGYLGDSIVGEWCNLGANTNVSNLKNTLSNVSLWNYEQENFIISDLKFLGMVMGDYSKTSINTSINTGTVIGVNANVISGTTPPKFIPSFSWFHHKFIEYHFEKALEVLANTKELINQKITKEEIHILQEVFDITQKYRQ